MNMPEPTSQEQQPDSLQTFDQELKRGQALADRYINPALTILESAATKGAMTLDAFKNLGNEQVIEAKQTRDTQVQTDPEAPATAETSDQAAELAYALEIKKFSAYLDSEEPTKAKIDDSLDQIEAKAKAGEDITKYIDGLRQAPTCIVKYRCPSIPEDAYNLIKGESHSNPKVNETFKQTQEQFIRDVAEIEADTSPVDIPFRSPAKAVRNAIQNGIKEYNTDPSKYTDQTEAYQLEISEEAAESHTLLIKTVDRTLAEITYSGEEPHLIKGDNLGEAYLACSHAANKDQSTDLGKLVNQASDALETYRDNQIQNITNAINQAQTAESPSALAPAPELDTATPAEKPATATATGEETEASAPPIKTLAERQRTYDLNQDELNQRLANIHEVITGLTKQLRNQGIGEAALTAADQTRQFDVIPTSIQDILDQGLLDITSADTRINGKPVTSEAGIKKYPKLAQELARSQLEAFKLAQTLPPDIINQYFPGLMDKLYPNGIPEGEPLPPLPKSKAERQQTYNDNKGSYDSQLQELQEGIKTLSQRISAAGIGEAALNQANATRTLGPKEAELNTLTTTLNDKLKLFKINDQPLPHLTLEAIQHNPKLARELNSMLQGLDNLTQNLPQDVIDQYFDGLFDSIYPDGIPENPPSFASQTEPSSTAEELEPSPKPSQETTTGPNGEIYPRWDKGNHTYTRDQFNEDGELHHLAESTNRIIAALESRFPEQTDRLALIQAVRYRATEVGKHQQTPNTHDPLYQALQQELASNNLDHGQFLTALNYVEDETKRLLHEDQNRQVELVWKQQNSPDFRRSTPANAEEELLLGVFDHSGPEMSATDEKTRNEVQRDLRAAQLLADFCLDTYNENARTHEWVVKNADGKVIGLKTDSEAVKWRQDYQRLLYTMLTTDEDTWSEVFTADQLAVAKRLKPKIEEFKSLPPSEAGQSYRGFVVEKVNPEDKTDKELYETSLTRWRNKGIEPPATGDRLAMAVKGLGLLDRRTQYLTTEPYHPKETFRNYKLVQQGPEEGINDPTNPSPELVDSDLDTDITSDPDVTVEDVDPAADSPSETNPSPAPEPESEPEPTPEVIPTAPLTRLSAAISAVRGQLEVTVTRKNALNRDKAVETQKRELFEAEASRLANTNATEVRDQWNWQDREGRSKREHIARGLRVHAGRVWKATFGEALHARKEIIHAQKEMATAGIESSATPFLTIKADQEARRRIADRRDSGWKRFKGGLRDFGNELRGHERELHQVRLKVIEEWRQKFDANPFDPEVPEELRNSIIGDFSGRAETAQRISDAVHNDQIDFAPGETGEAGIVLDANSSPEAKAVYEFYNQSLYKPAIDWALQNDGDIPLALELQLRQKENDFFLSPKFQTWRKTLTHEQQAKFDVSLSYGSTMVDRIKEVLIPNVRAARNHYEGQDRVDLAIELDLGTAKLGANGEVPKKFVGEKRVAVNQAVMDKLMAEQRADGTELDQFRSDYVDQSTKRSLFTAYIQDYTTTLGLPLAAALGAKSIGSGISAVASKLGVFVPVVGGVTAGTINGIKRFLSINRDRIQLDQEQAYAYQRMPDADQSREMAAKTYFKQEMGSRIADIDRLTQELNHSPSQEKAIQLIALVVDSQARSNVGFYRDLNLWQATLPPDSSLSPEAIYEQQKTAIPRKLAEAKVALFSLDDTLKNELATTAGMTGRDLPDIIDNLIKAQEEHLYSGVALSAELQAVIGSVSVEEAQSIQARDLAFDKSRGTDALVYGTQSGVFVTVMGIGSIPLAAAASAGIGAAAGIRTYRMLGRRPNPPDTRGRLKSALTIAGVTAGGTFVGGIAGNELMSLFRSGIRAIGPEEFAWSGIISKHFESSANIVPAALPALKKHELVQNTHQPDDWALSQASENVDVSPNADTITIKDSNGSPVIRITDTNGDTLIDTTRPGGPIHPDSQQVLVSHGLNVESHQISLATKPSHVINIAGHHFTAPGELKVSLYPDGTTSLSLDVDPADPSIPDVPDIHLTDIPAGSSPAKVAQILSGLTVNGKDVDVNWGTKTILNSSPATVSNQLPVIEVTDVDGSIHAIHPQIPQGTSLIADGQGNFDLVVDHLPQGDPNRVLVDNLSFDRLDPKTGQPIWDQATLDQLNDHHISVTYDHPQNIVTGRTPDITTTVSVPGSGHAPKIDTTGMSLTGFPRGNYLDNLTPGSPDSSETGFSIRFTKDGGAILSQNVDAFPTAVSNAAPNNPVDLVQAATEGRMHAIIGLPQGGQADLGAYDATGRLVIPPDSPNMQLLNPDAPSTGSSWANARYYLTGVLRSDGSAMDVVNSQAFTQASISETVTTPGEDIITRIAVPQLHLDQAITISTPEAIDIPDLPIYATTITHDPVSVTVPDGIFVPGGYRRPLESPEREQPEKNFDTYEEDFMPYEEGLYYEESGDNIKAPPWYDDKTEKTYTEEELHAYEQSLFDSLNIDYEDSSERLKKVHQELGMDYDESIPYREILVAVYEAAKRKKTTETLAKRRLSLQEKYLTRMRSRWQPNTTNDEILRGLYRLNGAERGYVEELELLNSSLPPMHPDCQMSVVIPAFNEENKIKNTLEDWLHQKQIDSDGNEIPLNPNKYEIILFRNRPNDKATYDNTTTIVEQIKADPRYKDFHIHIVEKTFNIADADINVSINGRELNIPKGRRMGLIYGIATDLAVLRNTTREAPETIKANHILKTGGADVVARDPLYIHQTLETFTNNPILEQYNSRSDYPPELYTHIPLFHVTERVREIMNMQYTSRRSALGLGVYRSSVYSEAGGFNPADEIAEEVRLNERMRAVMQRRSNKERLNRKDLTRRTTELRAIDDPRRFVAAIWQGVPMLHSYKDFWDNKAIKDMNVLDLLGKEVPPEAQLTPENITKQVDAYFKYFAEMYYKHGGGGKNRKDIQGNITASLDTASHDLRRTMALLGFKEGDFTISIPTDTSNIRSALRQASVQITTIKNVEPLLQEYAKRPKKDWTLQDYEATIRIVKKPEIDANKKIDIDFTGKEEFDPSTTDNVKKDRLETLMSEVYEIKDLTERKLRLIGLNKTFGRQMFIPQARQFLRTSSDRFQNNPNWETEWLSNLETTMLADRYHIPMAFMFRGGHAYVVTKPPELQTLGQNKDKYAITLYNPFQDGTEIIYIDNNDAERDGDNLISFSGAIPRLDPSSPEFRPDDMLHNWTVALRQANYNLSEPALPADKRWLIEAKQGGLQSGETDNCTLWSVYYAAIHTAMQPGFNQFKETGHDQWENDFGFRLLMFEDVSGGEEGYKKMIKWDD